MKILIVDDDANKTQHITKVMSEVDGYNFSFVTHETNIHSAKLLLEKNSFDLMVLDISLPNRIDKTVERDAGIKLLDALIENDEKYKMPSHIIAITAYRDIKEDFETNFLNRSISILEYDLTSNNWVRPLQAKLRQIITSKAAQETSVIDYKSFLCIISAIDLELDSVLRTNWGWNHYPTSFDNAIYYKGEINHEDSPKIVYAASAARMGMTSTAILAMKMIQSFRPKYIAMTGIAAGTPGKAKFGDVIVADPSWDYGSGKILNNSSEFLFHPTPHQISLTPNLRSKFKLFRENREILADIKHQWHGEKPDNELSVLIGPLASGASVVADGITISKVKMQHKELLGIEMETYSIFAVAEESTEPRPQAFSMKSVVDFGDGSKDDRFQRYGAYTSAQAMKYFVENYLI
jgi:nucleoside phosphorylase/CheY-like chemotaxis protein